MKTIFVTMRLEHSLEISDVWSLFSFYSKKTKTYWEILYISFVLKILDNF